MSRRRLGRDPPRSRQHQRDASASKARRSFFNRGHYRELRPARRARHRQRATIKPPTSSGPVIVAGFFVNSSWNVFSSAPGNVLLAFSVDGR